jgi:hypothetical protein
VIESIEGSDGFEGPDQSFACWGRQWRSLRSFIQVSRGPQLKFSDYAASDTISSLLSITWTGQSLLANVNQVVLGHFTLLQIIPCRCRPFHVIAMNIRPLQTNPHHFASNQVAPAWVDTQSALALR